MKTESVKINRGLVFDGLLFPTPRDRGLYIRNRAQWLEDNPDIKLRSVRDIQEKAGPLVETETDVGTTGVGPSSNTSCCDAPSDVKGDGATGLAEISVKETPPPQRQFPTTVQPTNIAPSPATIAEREIAIGGRPYVSTQCLASMLGVSERTRSRLCAGGKEPPNVKIGGKVYYELDKIPEWAANRQITLKTGLKDQSA
jgi:hypothetical protein